MLATIRQALPKSSTVGSDDLASGLVYGCAALGAWKLLQVGGDVGHGVLKHVLRPRRNHRARYGDANVTPWAVITGGAEGIGKAYAQELAQDGFNLILVDKNEAQLSSAAAELSKIVEVATIHFDFADLGTKSGFDKLKSVVEAKVGEKDVAILVNNVAEFQHELLVEADWDYVLRASNVNAHSYAAMTVLLIPAMLERHTKRGLRSAVVNVGTCAAEPQNPRYKFTIYGATKAYTHIFSSSLEEMYSDKLDVMTVIPRQTKTSMNPAGYKYTVTPAVHAKAVFDQLGYEKQTYGPLTHCLEYNMRFKYTLFGMFDKYVQWCNSSRNEHLIKVYNSNNPSSKK